jgi:hypothetical protein
MMHSARLIPAQHSGEAPAEAADAADRRVRELVEERRREVEVVADAASAAVGDDSRNGLPVDW